MPSQLVFSEENLINGNVFKFEQRLHSPVNKFIEGGAILATWFSQDQNQSTVDRGSGDVDELFGPKSPIRWNQINNVPLYQFGQANPENGEENNIEDITVDGECQIIPDTIVPQQYDTFIINHLSMVHLFEVTAVHYDSMKPDGYYKINYRLLGTEQRIIDTLKSKVVGIYHLDMKAVGTRMDSVVREEDYVYRNRVEKMVNSMIDAYIAMFYNERHNCFLFHDPSIGLDCFDMCGNEFIARYSLMNRGNSARVIVLHDKIRDPRMGLYNNNSIYNWLELGAPLSMLQPFNYELEPAESYEISSFAQWGQGNIQIMRPLPLQDTYGNNRKWSYFDHDQQTAFEDDQHCPVSSEYDALIWKYIHLNSKITLRDISLHTADALLSSINHRDTFLYTPMIIYIIRQVLGMC